ncbi:MAG TPA: hypothetical protein VJX72_08325 [Candidatus Acidoferrum sp.]|nr:hypothetical protein [Candidatus Acidoferrum sp.]
MKKTRINCVICAAVLLAFGFAGLTIQRMQAKSAASQPQPSDAPEMERLIKLYRGTWEYTETYSKSPHLPNGGENTGIYTSELGPGGMSIVNRFHSKGPVGDFEGLLVMTWDAKEKAYKAYVFGNDFPGALVETGQFEGDTLIFRANFNVGEKSIPIRNETRVDAKGVLTSDEFFGTPGPGAKETPFVHVVATRKP